VHSAKERFLAALDLHGFRYRDHGSWAQSQCPGHEDLEPSLTVYSKPGRIRVKCWAGCDDELDILPKLNLGWQDKYDQQRDKTRVRVVQPDPRIARRRAMGPVQRALDDLLQLPDLGERLCRSIAADELRWSSTEYALKRADEWFAAKPRPDDFKGGLPLPPKGYQHVPFRGRRDRHRDIAIADRDIAVTLALRDEVHQAIELDGRTGLLGQLAFLSEHISDYAAGGA
jgi:hypothetical protein